MDPIASNTYPLSAPAARVAPGVPSAPLSAGISTAPSPLAVKGFALPTLPNGTLINQPAASQSPNPSLLLQSPNSDSNAGPQPLTPEDLGQPPLWTWAAGTVAGFPLAWFLNDYLFGTPKDGSRYRIYKVASFIDSIPGISHVSHGIDRIGEWFRGQTATPEATSGSLPQWLKKPADKIVKAADPYLQQFFHQADELDALKLHADDYIGMLSPLETQQGAHNSGTIANLKQRINTLYQQARQLPSPAASANQVVANPAVNRLYKGLSTEIIRSARQVMDEPATIKQILNPQTLAQLSPALRQQVEAIAANAKNIDHARLKLSGLRMGKMFGFTSDGRTLGALANALKHQREKAWALQEASLLKQYLNDSVLKAANLTPEQMARLKQTQTAKEAQRLIRPGLLGRMGSPLTADQRKALAQPLSSLQNELLLRKRLYGVYGRLQGIKQFHLTFYGQERTMSHDMRKVAGSQYAGKKIGVIGRTLATWTKALRDMVDGSVAGASGGGKLNITRMLPNSKTLLPAVLMGMFFMNPIYEATKAEKGDKVKTFFYHLLGAEFGMMIGWQVGSLLFNEFHVPSNLAKGVDAVLNKVGIRSNLKSAMFRFTKWPFFTLSGFLGAFFLPTFITGSMFTKRGEKISSLIFGKPKSITEKEHQEKFQTLTDGKTAISTPNAAPASGLNTPSLQQPALPLPLGQTQTNKLPTPNTGQNAFTLPKQTVPTHTSPSPPVAPALLDAKALEKQIAQFTHPEANSNTYYGGLNTVDPSDVPATPAFSPRYA